jgi:hypothetical protein
MSRNVWWTVITVPFCACWTGLYGEAIVAFVVQIRPWWYVHYMESLVSTLLHAAYSPSSYLYHTNRVSFTYRAVQLAVHGSHGELPHELLLIASVGFVSLFTMSICLCFLSGSLHASMFMFSMYLHVCLSMFCMFCCVPFSVMNCL